VARQRHVGLRVGSIGARIAPPEPVEAVAVSRAPRTAEQLIIGQRRRPARDRSSGLRCRRLLHRCHRKHGRRRKHRRCVLALSEDGRVQLRQRLGPLVHPQQAGQRFARHHEEPAAIVHLDPALAPAARGQRALADHVQPQAADALLRVAVELPHPAQNLRRNPAIFVTGVEIDATVGIVRAKDEAHRTRSCGQSFRRGHGLVERAPGSLVCRAGRAARMGIDGPLVRLAGPVRVRRDARRHPLPPPLQLARNVLSHHRHARPLLRIARSGPVS